MAHSLPDDVNPSLYSRTTAATIPPTIPAAAVWRGAKFLEGAGVVLVEDEEELVVAGGEPLEVVVVTGAEVVVTAAPDEDTVVLQETDEGTDTPTPLQRFDA
jgi:hypothetical protein